MAAPVRRRSTPDIMGAVLGVKPVMLRIASIRRDGGTQPREQLVQEHVADLALALSEGKEVPAVDVNYDGIDYWLWDGFHRVAAHDARGLLEVPANIHQGTQRDARKRSTAVNASHGLRRTNADKRRQVLTWLEDEEWRQCSDNEIARYCGVSQPFVSELRKELSNNGYKMPEERTVTRNGATYQQTTAKIGKTAKPAPAAQSDPGAPLPPAQPATDWQAVRSGIPADLRELGEVQWCPGQGWRILGADGTVYGPALASLADCLVVLRRLQVAAQAAAERPLPAWVTDDAPVSSGGWTLDLDQDTDPAELGRTLRGLVDSEWMGRLWDAYMGEG